MHGSLLSRKLHKLYYGIVRQHNLTAVAKSPSSNGLDHAVLDVVIPVCCSLLTLWLRGN